MRCSTCNEATPLKPAPDGKRYIRCNCNCLLVCTESATTVACPRCRRHTNMRRQVIPTAPRSVQVKFSNKKNVRKFYGKFQLRCPCCRSEFSNPFPLDGSTHCPSCDIKLLLNKKTRSRRIFLSLYVKQLKLVVK